MSFLSYWFCVVVFLLHTMLLAGVAKNTDLRWDTQVFSWLEWVTTSFSSGCRCMDATHRTSVCMRKKKQHVWERRRHTGVWWQKEADRSSSSNTTRAAVPSAEVSVLHLTSCMIPNKSFTLPHTLRQQSTVCAVGTFFRTFKWSSKTHGYFNQLKF